MTTLFVCHSAGDTDALLTTYNHMSQDDKDQVSFLAMGNVAYNKLYQKGLAFHYLHDQIDTDTASDTEIMELTQEQVAELLQNLDPDQTIDQALIGTPSNPQARSSWQVAKTLSSQLKYGAVYNDYLFLDPQHVFFDELKSQNQWLHNYTWFAPVAKAKRQFEQANGSLSIKTAGHWALEDVLNTPTQANSHNQTRQALHVSCEQGLLFISGTKNIEQDRQLMEALLQTLQSGQYRDIQVRIGIHPGVSNVQDYLDEMNQCLAEYSQVKEQIQLVVPQRLVDSKGLDMSRYHESDYCLADVSGDQAAQAADGVACAVAATLPNKSATQGKPAYYHEDYEPYLPKDRLFSGSTNLPFFLQKVQNKHKQKPLSREDLDIPEQGFGAYMAQQFITN
jgi:hypothetical protein